MRELGIYIHIPYCLKKCLYCDFYSVSIDKATVSMHAYADKLCDEIRSCTEMQADDTIVNSIYLGGGTPGCMKTDDIARILQTVKNKFIIAADCEISIELNPETVDNDKCRELFHAGFNRVSMGVQSLSDTVLKTLGRVHTAAKAEEAYFGLRNAGFKNINLDLMFGVPKQDFDIFSHDLQKIIAMAPEHISFYSLQIEEGTAFYELYKNGDIDIPQQAEDRAMYHYAVRELKQNGYHHYEISNAAKPGFECRHNLKYWTMQSYLGFGSSAHSFNGRYRYFNSSDLCYHRIIEEYESERELETDRIFTGLRLTDGIDFGRDFCNKYSSIIDELSADDYLNRSGTRLSLTEKALDNTNYVLGRLMNG